MPPRKGTVVNEDAPPTVAITARAPADVSARIDDLAVRSGLGRTDVISLALSRIPDNLIPPELFAAADVMRDIRRVR